MKRILLVAPVAVLLSGTSVFALTADQVWADLQALAADNQSEIKAATEVKDDGVITLTGVSLGPVGKPAVTTIAELSIEEQDDGAVALFPEDIKVAGADGSTGSVEQEGLSVTVFEDEGGLGYALFADVLNVAFDSNPGADGAAKRAAGTFAFEGLEAHYGRGKEAITVDAVAKHMTTDVAQSDPAMSLDQTSSSDTADLELSGELVLPEGVDLLALDAPGAFPAAMAKGLALAMNWKSGAATSVVDDRNPMMPFSGKFSSPGGTFDVSADQSAFSVDTEMPGLSVEFTPAGAPMAFPVAMDTLKLSYLMPLAAPEGGEFGLALKLSNLVLGEELWAMVDPGAALPREPANLDLDIAGTAKMDVLAMAAAEEQGMGSVAPPEPLTLDIRSLGLQLAGAALSGTGAFTFDNSMLEMGGPPMPIGSANLRLEGGNRLIDGLIAIGLLKEEDAMGARMMMAMFGKAEGEDVLTSQVEAKEGGSIFVNGQQIQ